jgi:phosphatidylglycerol:prolipoprotein diacylglycerol transferase
MLEPLTIQIGIDPTIGHMGGLMLAWHGVFIAVGIAAGVYVAVLMARRKGFLDEDSYNVAMAAVIGGIVGARALFVAENWGQLDGNIWNALRINEGGISVYGGIIGGIVGGLSYGLCKRLPISKGLDAGAVGLILGQAIGRIGCVINGEHIGTPSNLPWAMEYTNVNSPSFALGTRQPAAGYEMLGDFLILGVLLLLWRISKRTGLSSPYALLCCSASA